MNKEKIPVCNLKGLLYDNIILDSALENLSNEIIEDNIIESFTVYIKNAINIEKAKSKNKSKDKLNIEVEPLIQNLKNYLSNNRVSEKLQNIYKEVKDSVKLIKKFFKDNLINSEKEEEFEISVELETEEKQTIGDIREKKDKFYGFINKVTDIESELKNNIHIFICDILKKANEENPQSLQVQVEVNSSLISFEEAVSAFINKRIDVEERNNKGTIAFADSLINLSNENKRLYDSLSKSKYEIDELKYYNDKYRISDNWY